MIVPCIVNSWLNCSFDRNCSPGTASSPRISSAIAPPAMKNPNDVTRYRIPMSFGSVVRSILANVAPFGVLRAGYGGAIGFGSTAVIGGSLRWAAETTVGPGERPVSPRSTGARQAAVRTDFYDVSVTRPALLDRLPAVPGSVMRVLAIAAVVAQAGIAVTGSVVRVTGSGLGCPTWPECVPGSLVPTPHPEVEPVTQWIEFGNRLLTFAVVLVTGLCLLAALATRPRRPRLTRLALVQPLGVVAQAVIGGGAPRPPPAGRGAGRAP